MVADNGIGLPDNRGQLTEPYVTHKPKGTGLGLAIVKKIMEDHGGRIVLEDRAEGPGAVAILILPVEAAMPSDGKPGLALAAPGPGGQPTRVSNGA